MIKGVEEGDGNDTPIASDTISTYWIKGNDRMIK